MATQDVLDKYEMTIGIESHVQLKTASKLFSPADNDARDKEPNTCVHPIDFGLPGMLPLLNKEAVDLAIKAGKAMNCAIANVSRFDRKHYFYPDLPNGYQITQMYHPTILGGIVEAPLEDGGTVRVRINHAHLEAELTAYQARTRAVNESIQGLLQSKKLLDHEIAITEPMAAKGVVSEVEILRMKRQANELQLQMTERRNKFQSDANTELVRVEAELAQSEEAMTARADPVTRSEIKAPLRGVVKNIRINTVGGVIGVGQDIMEIVPVDGPLLVEAYIRPQDVAFIKPSDEALVKLTAYDYALYGGLEGKVTLISPDTLQDNRRPSELKLNADESYYRVIVETTESRLQDKDGRPLPIIPGMIATVDIKTGEKTVFQYLTKPITRLKQALRER